MEIFLSAALGELTTRSINFIISKCSKAPTHDVEDRLGRVLLRAQVIIDEAMWRHITNPAMHQKLDMLRNSMYRGYYILDTFRYQSHKEDESKDQMVSHSSLLSKVNSVKDFCFSSGKRTHILKEMCEVLDSLSSMIPDSDELVLFLMSYPRMYREPYNMHLLLSKVMFGRQMERELMINFLLRKHPQGTKELEVLPIVGPGKVGKSTLVAHVCNDERVRDQFSEIIFFNAHDFQDEVFTTLEGHAKKYHCVPNKDGRILIVVEATGDFSEGAWKRLYSASKQYFTSGNKIIITSRSDKIVKFGTTRAITLKYLSNEEYWYLFKTLMFGSTDPRTYPKLTNLAMEITQMLDGDIIAANGTASVLRDNFDIQFSCKVLSFLKGMLQKHVSKFGEHPNDVVRQNRPAHLGRMGRPSEALIVYDQYQCSSMEKVPKITIADVMYGGIKPHGKFEVLGWRSQIPPCYNYIFNCEIRELKTAAAKRKRSMRNGANGVTLY
ncbi:hypothetical protein ACP4OV_012059 [Aristida adscensionis]